ncbi:SDR family NAD(P)-dependent oxidoreductase [Dyadobacter sp. CY356]|uniref:SDR family NAD(P)-dependent oxidoreductase n=1 Tax=Dyadobacter sp. CY356 TaxID=2906442 RepID=UPI001F3D6911|nr:SDR family NAD(P)-dependent oxidoreductase [Dyadobacter sp. CY356]MCF0059022.1 SDR family NAD(P)-dependent oxidoreductase [Dyadobacter sp. CY356]
MAKNIIISGASGGLGRDVVKKLSDLGNHLYVTFGSKNTDTFSGFENVTGQVVDLTNNDESVNFIDTTLEKAKTIQAGIFLVGAYAPGGLDKTDDALLAKMFNLNFFTAFHLVKPLMEHFKANGGGQFIFVGARPALEADQGKGNFAYALSKSLVFKMAEFINAEGKADNITATVIVPSTIDTPTNREAMPDADFTKWISASDIAESIAFILTDSGQKLRETVFKIYNNS